MRLAPAGKVQDALLLAIVEEEVEGPHIPYLTCIKLVINYDTTNRGGRAI